MRPEDLFEEGSPDPVFGLATRRVKTELLTALRTGPLDGADDIEVAIPLALPDPRRPGEVWNRRRSGDV
jgi:hypothetical protein